jgi:hypothetical protein
LRTESMNACASRGLAPKDSSRFEPVSMGTSSCLPAAKTLFGSLADQPAIHHGSIRAAGRRASPRATSRPVVGRFVTRLEIID